MNAKEFINNLSDIVTNFELRVMEYGNIEEGVDISIGKESMTLTAVAEDEDGYSTGCCQELELDDDANEIDVLNFTFY